VFDKEHVTAVLLSVSKNLACAMLYRVSMTTSTNFDVNISRRSLSLKVLRWSQERVHTTKSIINDMLRGSEISDVEAPHLKAALEAFEKAEAELNLLN
jgi:hypothetical protein